MILAAILAAVVAMPASTDGVQEPPLRFLAIRGEVRVAFYLPGEVNQICSPLVIHPPGERVLACYWPAGKVIVMPNPWQCGSYARCAALWRHETAHALSGWEHEAR